MSFRTVGPMVRQWQALIESDVSLETRKLYTTEAFRADVGDRSEDGGPAPATTLRGFIERRRAFLLK